MVVPFEIFDGYVLLNGAKAYIDNSLVYDKTISPDIFMPFLRELSEKNFKIAAEIEDVHYANFNVQEKRIGLKISLLLIIKMSLAALINYMSS